MAYIVLSVICDRPIILVLPQNGHMTYFLPDFVLFLPYESLPGVGMRVEKGGREERKPEALGDYNFEQGACLVPWLLT